MPAVTVDGVRFGPRPHPKYVPASCLVRTARSRVLTTCLTCGMDRRAAAGTVPPKPLHRPRPTLHRPTHRPLSFRRLYS